VVRNQKTPTHTNFMIDTELKIPIVIAGIFVGYTLSHNKVKGAIIGGLITLATALYVEHELKNIPEYSEIAEYEILNDNENENNRNK